MKKIIYFLTFNLYFVPLSSFAQPTEGGWRAGVARINITPETSLWMAGFASRDHIATGTMHNLWAKALALEDKNKHRVVLITIDICSISKGIADRIRNRISKEEGIAKADIIVNCSQTLSSPVLDDDALFNIYPFDSVQGQLIKKYTSLFEENAVRVARNALDDLEPVTLFSENGVASFQVNRRTNNETSLLYQSELHGPNDYSVPVIKVLNADQKIKGILFGYACRNAVLNGYEWSGDYAGFAQIELEQMFPGATAMFFMGASANLDALPRKEKRFALQYGRELAFAVEKVINEDMKPLSPKLVTAYEEINLALTKPDKKELISILSDTTKSYLHYITNKIVSKINRGEKVATTTRYPVQVWKIGEQPLFALGGELVVEYAIEIKKLFGDQTFVMGFSNGIISYIPTLSILKESNNKGSKNVFYNPINYAYEGNTETQLVYGLPSIFEADIEHRIMDAVFNLAKTAGVSLKN